MIEPFIRETVIRVTGVFDRDSAARLRGALTSAWASEPGTVLIDFSLTQEVSDVALAAMLNPLRGGDVRLRFRGLTQRQRQLIRLLAPGAIDRNATPATPVETVDAGATRARTT